MEFISGRFQLRGDIYGQGGCVELTDGKIKHAAIKRTMGGRIDHATTNQKSARMCVLRVGAVAPGETPPSNTAINREDGATTNHQTNEGKVELHKCGTIHCKKLEHFMEFIIIVIVFGLFLV